MSNTLVLATILHCVFSPPGHESGPEKLIGVMNIRMDDASAASVAAKQPPIATASYSGEPASQREWNFAGSGPDQSGQYTIVRVVPSSDFFNPYNFRMGKVTELGGEQYKFEQVVAGVCQLMSENELPEGERQ